MNEIVTCATKRFGTVIPINDCWRITCDQQQWIVERGYAVKKTGSIRWRPTWYFQSLDRAGVRVLDAILKEDVADIPLGWPEAFESLCAKVDEAKYEITRATGDLVRQLDAAGRDRLGITRGSDQ